MTSGFLWKPYHNKNMPRAQHSAFGDFPKEIMQRQTATVSDVRPIDKMEVSLAATGTAILKKGDGLGGRSTSLNKPKPKPPVQKPVAGATFRR